MQAKVNGATCASNVSGQPELVTEIIAKRIIEAANKGERDGRAGAARPNASRPSDNSLQRLTASKIGTTPAAIASEARPPKWPATTMDVQAVSPRWSAGRAKV